MLAVSGEKLFRYVVDIIDLNYTVFCYLSGLTMVKNLKFDEFHTKSKFVQLRHTTQKAIINIALVRKKEVFLYLKFQDCTLGIFVKKMPQ